MLDYATQASRAVDRFILWQPAMNGQAWLTQWLRLRLVGQMVDGDGSQEQTGSMQALRATLAQGHCLEVAGYELAPEMAAAIDAVDGAALAPAGCMVDWFDVVAGAGRPVAPATAKLVADWQRRQIVLQHHQVVGQAFWALPEISACPALISATLAAFCMSAA